MIELIDICNTYPINHGRSHRLVLSNVNLRVDLGDRCGILGRSGGGKSTLFRIIGGSDKPQSATIRKTVTIAMSMTFGEAIDAYLAL